MVETVAGNADEGTVTNGRVIQLLCLSKGLSPMQEAEADMAADKKVDVVTLSFAADESPSIQCIIQLLAEASLLPAYGQAGPSGVSRV